jgi:hypothetical protein
MIHSPKDLETAVSLALLQEEIEEDEPKNVHRPVAAKSMHMHNFTPAHVKGPDQRSADKSNAVTSKIATLCAYRKARWECFTCGEKWAPGHKCSTTVSLHVVEELLAMLSVEDTEGEQSTQDTEVFEDALHDAQEVFMSISKQALNGSEAPKSMRLLGHIQGHDVLILLDSGSSAYFISSSLAEKLEGVQKM